jgi:RNA polymerase sigma-54 factor
MKLSLDIKTSLTQTLTPQQIQYLKLLQLPLVQFEQQLRQEIEQNPMLEESGLDDDLIGTENEDPVIAESPQMEDVESSFTNGAESEQDRIDDAVDPFEFSHMIWQEDSGTSYSGNTSHNDDDNSEPFQIKSSKTFIEEFTEQFRLIPLSEEEYILGEQIIGNVDSDGYLRRDLLEIVEETNSLIVDLNYQKHKEERKYAKQPAMDNPARQFAITEDKFKMVESARKLANSSEVITVKPEPKEHLLQAKSNGQLHLVDLEMAEKVLSIIQNMEPAGIASRNVQECLIAQCRNYPRKSAAQKLALMILTEAYEEFSMKHYKLITKKFEITELYLKEAIDFIRRLNPKPGGDEFQEEINTVIPDFIISKDEESNELIIDINDNRLPSLKLNKAYEKLKKETDYKKFNKETKDWIRNKYEDAKFLIQAIRQRKSTMLKVMTAIAHLQKDFFYKGPSALKPLIYKDISEETALDISTVCRIVNGKYVQTEFGTFELKFFFSESLPSDDGEEVSTTVIKQIIRDIVDNESKDKPLSDDKISAILKEKGYQVARRTIAKYRDQLKIPVARLRKEL